jgi:hypothetical protein
MDLSPWEGANRSATQEFPTFYITWRFTRVFYWSLSCARWIQSIAPRPISLRIIIISSGLLLSLPSGLFLSGFPTKTPYAFPYSLCVLDAQSVSSSLTWSLYLAKSISYEAPHYAVFSILIFVHSLSVQIPSSASCSQIPSVYVIPLTSETKFHAHTNYRQNYSFIYFNRNVFRQQVVG